MLLHLVATEQFRTERCLVTGVLLCQTVSAVSRPQMEHLPENDLAAKLQALNLLISTCREVSFVTCFKISLCLIHSYVQCSAKHKVCLK
jgi:hypothetical protein